jgi:ribosomal-protein-alanine N-acetyltransferase
MPCGGDWSIRSMGFADLDTVVTLEKRIFSSPWSADLFRYELGHDDRTIYLVLEECDRVVGYIGSQVLDQEIHVTNMAVEPEARRRGLGSALLLECVRLGLGRGARWVTLEVRLGNDEALDFYRTRKRTRSSWLPATSGRLSSQTSSRVSSASSPRREAGSSASPRDRDLLRRVGGRPGA